MTNPSEDIIIFVNTEGRPTGETGPKLESHNGATKLHLAFSCYVFNDKGEFLVTQRAKVKKVWPGVWTNSVCGHPKPVNQANSSWEVESMEDAIKRRLDYELGMTARDIQVILPKYIYKTPPYNGIIEHEFCPIYIARATSEPQPNPEEVDGFKWVDWQDFVQAAESDKDNKYSWWCKDQLKRIKTHPLIAKYSKTTFESGE